jgi:hypothetical protein
MTRIEEKFKPTILVKRHVLIEDCLKNGVYHMAIKTIKIRDEKDVSKILGNKRQAEMESGK